MFGVLAPAGTPAPVIDRLNGELAEILQLPDVQEKLQEQGVSVAHAPPEEARQRIHDEVTVKRVRQRRHMVELNPENPAFETIAIDTRRQPLAIEGVVVGVIRTGKL